VFGELPSLTVKRRPGGLYGGALRYSSATPLNTWNAVMHSRSYVSPAQSVTLLLAGYLLLAHGWSQVRKPQELFADNAEPGTMRKFVQEVDVVFTVKDRHNRLMRNLTPAEISIYDNGKLPEQITYFRSNTRLPLLLALVIDVSDSVSCCAKFEEKAAEIFVQHELHSASDVALLVGFNEHAWVQQSATSDSRPLTRSIKHLPLGGKTAVFDAVALASRQLASVPSSAPSLKAIILITDGDDNSSEISLKEAEDIAQQNETLVFTLNTQSAPLRSESVEKNMKTLSKVTGGEYFLADEEHIRRALAKIEDELRSQYAIGYKPVHSDPDGSFHTISIVAPRKLKVQHRQGYFAR
jgi:VWFA-related protein